MEKAYYAIIPANVRYDENLKDKAKLLYGEITALTNDKGFCWASNSYFAELYKVTKETISRLIKNLVDAGYITIELVYEGKEILGRKIYIESSIPIDKNINTPIDEKINTYCQKNQNPIDEKVKDNNTINNKKEKRKTEFDEVINSYTENQDLKNAIYEFIKYRKSVKATLTTLALKKNLNKLNNISSSDKEKIAILENSIMNGWKGIFPLNESEKPRIRSNPNHLAPEEKIEIDKSKLGGI
ncbi:helix-turn-helix domain-containing protein [Clostridium cadaveris]|uniref:helix-turn-helix domain-containing protein n=1 Tax=Clostridium cadaveris TaxID=1529 RepID=UPI000C082C7A|nr:helix-turn-helix domain-containing protein [Clostridium cadaveris]